MNIWVIFIIALVISISIILLIRWLINYHKKKVQIAEQIASDLKESNKFLNSIIDNNPYAIWISDAEGTLIRINKACCQILNIREEEVLGKYNIFKDNIVEEQGYMPLVKNVFEKADVARFVISYDTSSLRSLSLQTTGKVVLELIIFPIVNSQGKVTHAVTQHFDVTEQKKMEETLRKSEQRLSFALDGANDGMWEVQLTTDVAFLSRTGCKIFGYTFEEFNDDKKIWKDLVHPDDIAATNDVLKSYLNGEMDIFSIEHRLKMKSGEYKYILSRGKTVAFANDGTPLRMIGTHTDITERKKAEFLLQERNREIKAQNEEYKRINEELYKAKIYAEQSDRLKTVFLQNMSHEIRTPMNAIMGFSEILGDYFDNRIKLKKFTGIIKQRSADLLELINEILDLSKIETGQLSINIENCTLPDLFADLHEFFINYRQNLDKLHIDIRIKNDSRLPFKLILTDVVKLKQVFINLIQNALKFTDQGYVEFGCFLNAENTLMFFVTDTGMGIPENKQSFIFERFTQLPTDGLTPQKGTGLGLAIVKGLVELMGGKISLQSETGKGSTFYFSFPYEVPLTNDENLTKNKAHNHIAQWKKYSVLIVEDDIYNTEYLKEILADTGISMNSVSSGRLAIDFVKSDQAIDIILMDIGLPDMDGYEAIGRIKEIRPDVKIIAQTAYATNEDKCNAIKAGCHDYISKPINKNMLIDKMQEHLN